MTAVTKALLALLLVILVAPVCAQSARAQDNPCGSDVNCLWLFVDVRCNNTDEFKPPRYPNLVARVVDVSVPSVPQNFHISLAEEGINWLGYELAFFGRGDHAYSVRFLLDGRPIGDDTGPVDPPNSVGVLLIPTCYRSFLTPVGIK